MLFTRINCWLTKYFHEMEKKIKNRGIRKIFPVNKGIRGNF